VELLLVRHALPQKVELDSGPADPELAPEGWKQAGRLAAWLASEPLDVVYTSPLRRAVQTAEPLAEVIGQAVHVCDGVAEWDRESSSYVPIEELQATQDPVWKALAAGALHELGVDPVAFQQRVVGSLAEVAARHRGERVVVVCHGGVLNAYLADVLGLDRVLFFRPDYTGISRVRVAPDGRRTVQSVNETGHLHT
jgi:probable phosphoglycerate mutase